MSNTKTQFKWFSIPEYDKEQEYLRQMHKSGWKLVRIGFPGVYHFEACQPEDVVYQLDYNPEGTENITDTISKQASNSVRWESIIRDMAANGVDTFIEIGPGKTLAGFMKRIDRKIKCINIETVKDMEKLEALIC